MALKKGRLLSTPSSDYWLPCLLLTTGRGSFQTHLSEIRLEGNVGEV